MKRSNWVKLVFVLATVVAVGVVQPAAAAPAKDGDVLVSGACNKSSSAKLKLSREDGRIEVEFEVDQNRTGVRWAVTLTQNGSRIFAGSRTTSGRSGSFELRKLAANRAGRDAFTASATSPSGEVCRARASF